jgi:alpha-ketoglutarate-dependent 2,4-dichlorophenoxyacetate dioxygenase
MAHDALSDISNLDAGGKVVAADSTKAIMNVSNRFWHTDAAYEHYPFCYSIMAAIRVPSWGGETQFADLRAAYDTLEERTRTLIADRTATFYAYQTRHGLGIEDGDALLHAYPPVNWPMVRMHPGSARKVLWVDSKVIEISGMSVPEGRALAHELVEHATQRERVYSHKWSANDVVMWDNRSVLHRGRRFDPDERREMRRVATVCDAGSLGEGSLPAYVPAKARSQRQSSG